jgi:hypothetical protein
VAKHDLLMPGRYRWKCLIRLRPSGSVLGVGAGGTVEYFGHDGNSWVGPLSPLTRDLRGQGYAEDVRPEAAENSSLQSHPARDFC